MARASVTRDRCNPYGRKSCSRSRSSSLMDSDRNLATRIENNECLRHHLGMEEVHTLTDIVMLTSAQCVAVGILLKKKEYKDGAKMVARRVDT